MDNVLRSAVIKDDLETVRSAIKGGANVCSMSEEGFTVLHMAAIRARTPEILEELLSAGANLAIKDDCGNTPVDLILGNPNLFEFRENTLLKRIIEGYFYTKGQLEGRISNG